MKLMLIIISLFLHVTLVAQTKAKAPVDTLLIVPLSRVQYCMSKVEEVKILNDRVLVKNQEIALANNRVTKKEEEIKVWEEQYKSATAQRDINQNKLNIANKLLEDSEKKVKSLKKQNTGLKIGGGILVILALLI